MSTAVRPTKPCPHCNGSGRVPYDPRRAEQNRLNEEWAMRYHGQLVSVVDHVWHETRYVGVAVAKRIQGGYWKLRIYTVDSVKDARARHHNVTRVNPWEWGPRFPYAELSRLGVERDGRASLSVVPVWDVQSDELRGLLAMGQEVGVSS